MERNDIALVRRWADEIAKDEVAELELKIKSLLEPINHQIEKAVLKARKQGEDIEKVKGQIAQNELATLKDFSEIKAELTKKPKPKGRPKIEKAVAPAVETRASSPKN